jgi:hypothetical protein
MAEQAIIAFFFALQSCECTATPTPGKTTAVNLVGGIVFQDQNKKILPNDSPEIADAKCMSFALRIRRTTRKMTVAPSAVLTTWSFVPGAVHHPLWPASCSFLSQQTTALPPSTPFLLVELSLRCHKISRTETAFKSPPLPLAEKRPLAAWPLTLEPSHCGLAPQWHCSCCSAGGSQPPSWFASAHRFWNGQTT